MPNYLFDVKLFATLRLDAPDTHTARRWLSEALDCAEVHCGALPSGDPLVGEASPDGELNLVEVDGEEVDGEEEVEDEQD
jgi:hypothetical protein